MNRGPREFIIRGTPPSAGEPVPGVGQDGLQVKVCDLRRQALEPCALDVLAQALFEPTREQACRRMTAYLEQGSGIWGALCGEHLAGVLVTRALPGGLEIQSLAVAAAQRGQGVGRAMVDWAAEALELPLWAETDADAVGFYARCGFEVVSLGEKYPGVVRFRVTRK